MARYVESQQQDRIRARLEGRGALIPWLGWVLGPAAWAAHLGIGFAMIPWLCEIGRSWPYHALTAFCLLLCGLGVVAAAVTLRRACSLSPDRSAQRLRMMALGGFMLTLGAVGGIAVEYAGFFWIDVCAGVA